MYHYISAIVVILLCYLICFNFNSNSKNNILYSYISLTIAYKLVFDVNLMVYITTFYMIIILTALITEKCGLKFLKGGEGLIIFFSAILSLRLIVFNFVMCCYDFIIYNKLDSYTYIHLILTGCYGLFLYTKIYKL